MAQESTLKVIGAGWGRTGTDSTKEALNRLGYRCHHMHELLKCPKSAQKFWAQALQSKYGPPHMEPRQWEKQAAQMDWNSQGFVGGFDACVDFPFAPFYKELLAANPDAKVILNVRDADKWYKSVYDTIYGFHRQAGLFCYILSLLGTLPMLNAQRALWGGLLEGTMEDQAKATALFRKHIEEVKRTVPPEKLLVFSVKEGWGPLCKFLGKPVPHEPFPHVNSSSEKRRRLGILRIVEMATNLVVAGVVLAGGLWCWGMI
eukprot:m.8299 g.8299  ORF g.8299 m.8299 type:complete len:260 (+) comp6938_c0_seq1:71-850(+)